jgi:hypothetical protein
MQLMSERQKYEKWLRDLEAKKDSTPEKVFERVHQDYSERLEEVLDGLRQHTTALQDHARNLMVRLKELEIAEEELSDEQSENALRAQVGEISSSEWESSKRKADKVLAKFKEDQAQVADDLNQLREILADAAGQPADTPPTGVPRKSTDFDELEFLKSVVGQPTPQSSSSAGMRRSTRGAPPAEKPAPRPISSRPQAAEIQPTEKATPAEEPSFPNPQLSGKRRDENCEVR